MMQVSDAEDEINTNIDTDIQGYDIDPEVIRTAKRTLSGQVLRNWFIFR